MELPPGDFDGFIFDCDGTLADTMPLHYEAWCAAFRDIGATFYFEEDEFYNMGGLSTRMVVEEMNRKHATNFDVPALVHYKEELFLKRLPEVKPIPEVVSFARLQIAAGRPVSVASGGMPHVVGSTLEFLGLRELFPIIVTPGDVARGKPAPDLFLLAAERMGVAPARCLVFEDGVPGIEAAQAAGMACVIVPRGGF
jgi:HAD superfamily hydrolase (TIGR01509 family)